MMKIDYEKTGRNVTHLSLPELHALMYYFEKQISIYQKFIETCTGDKGQHLTDQEVALFRSQLQLSKEAVNMVRLVVMMKAADIIVLEGQENGTS